MGRLIDHKDIEILIAAIDESMSLEVVGKPYEDGYLEKLSQLSHG